MTTPPTLWKSLLYYSIIGQKTYLEKKPNPSLSAAFAAKKEDRAVKAVFIH
jgi:hypothetical protein